MLDILVQVIAYGLTTDIAVTRIFQALKDNNIKDIEMIKGIKHLETNGTMTKLNMTIVQFKIRTTHHTMREDIFKIIGDCKEYCDIRVLPVLN